MATFTTNQSKAVFYNVNLGEGGGSMGFEKQDTAAEQQNISINYLRLAVKKVAIWQVRSSRMVHSKTAREGRLGLTGESGHVVLPHSCHT
ncbi:hypothetical protein E2C01_078937 [Portunus trituberculatus]|uniref:Uncharacterized protein n=1 Tax=Portunus trituberculatus TaxID=210409 RepID=A0A5B7IU85_PORTR|nr:hypothetical protein [Portunus trituberculatus]